MSLLSAEHCASGTADAELPRITIITPSRNGVHYVQQAIESVKAQAYPKLEHIVFDACSTDGTPEVLQRYPEVTVICEPDGGAHDAMNKGIARARGEVIGFLNTDDFFAEDVLRVVGQYFAADPALEMVAGGCVYFCDTADGQRLVLHRRSHRSMAGLWPPELMFGVVGINGCFFARRVFERIGDFDNSYYIGADRHLMLRAMLAGMCYAWLDRPVVWYRIHEGSSTFDQQMRNLLPIGQEHFRMAGEFAGITRDRSQLRQAFLSWHAFEGAKLLLRLTRRGQLSDTLQTLRTLMRHNPLWALRLPRALALRHETREQDRRDMNVG